MPPLLYDPDGPGPAQPGLPGMFREEAPLTSEVVLDGGLLDQHRRQALAALRELLHDRPPDITPEEWRVVVATLAAPVGHLGRVPGSAARTSGIVKAARECFPGVAATTAVRRFREAQDRPAVRRFIADLRALELADALEQRALVREALTTILAKGTEALHGLDAASAPSEWAKVSAAMVTAAKVLSDMDGLAVRPEEAAEARVGTVDTEAEDVTVGEALAAKLAPVLADVRARRERENSPA